MKIKIDMRETELISLIKENMEKVKAFKDLSSSSSSPIDVVIENLPLGDIILTDSTGEKDVIIIERKSLSDLTASIKDGRYEEQSFRLHHLEGVPNHNIIYLIEGGFSYSNTNTVSGFGKISKYNKFNSHSDNDKCMLYSAMFSVLYYKGFSVFRTTSLKDTAFFICNTACKLVREEKAGLKKPFYSNEIKENKPEKPDDKLEEVEEETTKSYSHVVKKVKKDNITPENIGEIMLCQMPGVSAVTAVAIMDKYKTIPQLIYCMKENPNCLKDITYTNNKSQTRRLNKTVVENIGKYLCMM
jgi:ERCC4-type nuclease